MFRLKNTLYKLRSRTSDANCIHMEPTAESIDNRINPSAVPTSVRPWSSSKRAASKQVVWPSRSNTTSSTRRKCSACYACCVTGEASPRYSLGSQSSAKLRRFVLQMYATYSAYMSTTAPRPPAPAPRPRHSSIRYSLQHHTP